MIGAIWNWLKAWFDPRSFGSGNGISLSRRLMTLFVVVVCFSLAWDVVVVKRGITIPWASVAASLGAVIGGIWGIGKLRKDPPPPEAK